MDQVTLQRRTMRVLVTSQVLGGIGVGAGISVVGLLAYELSGEEALSGISATAGVLGAAGAALVIARIAVARGRRPSLAAGYLVGAVGAALAIVAAVLDTFPLHVVASIAFGWSNAANLQSRFAATDLATADQRSRALSTVVWATTVGAVLGPNLTGPGGVVADTLGLPMLAGAYLFSLLSFVAAALVQLIWLRPDPLVVSRREPKAPVNVLQRGALRTGWDAIRVSPRAISGVSAVAIAHATMVGVMVMTPVHMEHHGAALNLVGLTISLHIAGMYALSPVVGWLSDRIGREPVLLLGVAQLFAAATFAATANPVHSTLFQVGLVLLGTGWSCCLVAGSTLLTEHVDQDHRAAAQGTSDLVMNLSGGLGGTLAGIVLAVAGYTALAFGAISLLAIPVWFMFVARRASSRPDEPADAVR